MTQPRLPALGERIYGELDSIALDRLVGEAEILLPQVSTGPWKADISENIGNNWLLGSFGQSEAGASWILTTDGVHCSEVESFDAEADAKFCALARNLVPLLIEELRRRK